MRIGNDCPFGRMSFWGRAALQVGFMCQFEQELALCQAVKSTEVTMGHVKHWKVLVSHLLGKQDMATEICE